MMALLALATSRLIRVCLAYRVENRRHLIFNCAAIVLGDLVEVRVVHDGVPSERLAHEIRRINPNRAALHSGYLAAVKPYGVTPLPCAAASVRLDELR